MSFRTLTGAPIRAIVALHALAAAGACDLSTEADQDTFFVSFATDPASAAGSAEDITVAGGGNTLVISSVEFVVDEPGLTLYNGESGCAGGAPGECVALGPGPVLVSLPIGGDESPVVTPLQTRAPERLYQAFDFVLHTPQTGNAGDQEFLQEHPSFAGVGIRVTGTWNGEPFELARAIDAEIGIVFEETFPGDEGWNLTVATAVSEWFLSSGLTPVPFDPSTAVAGGANDERFVGNVVSSFRAFRDFDRDGENDTLD